MQRTTTRPQAKPKTASKDYIVERIIEEALRRGYSLPQIIALLAIANIESDFRPDIVGDRGTSFGLFQVNRSRFPKYGVTPETAKKLFDLDYLLPRVFADFDELNRRLRRTHPDIFQDIPADASPEDFRERVAKTFAIYATYWNRPALLDDVLRDPRAFNQVYPKVNRDVMRRKLHEAIALVQKHLPKSAEKIRTTTLQELAKFLGVTPETRVPPPHIQKVQPEAPALSTIYQSLFALPQYLAAGQAFNRLLEQYRREGKEPPVKYQYTPLPGHTPVNEYEKIVSHFFNRFVPGFPQLWERMSPAERIAFISQTSALLKQVLPLHNQIVAERDPQKKAELQRRLENTFKQWIVNLPQLVPSLKERPRTALERAKELGVAVGTFFKELGVGIIKDVIASLMIIPPAALDPKRDYTIRDPKTGELRKVPYREYLRHRIDEVTDEYYKHAPKAPEREVVRRLLHETLPVKPRAVIDHIIDTIGGGMIDIVGGLFEMVGAIGDYIAGLFGRETKARKAIEQWFAERSRAVLAAARALSEHPEFRRYHQNYAFNFLLAVAPDEIDKKSKQPTRYGWYLYAQHVLLSSMLDIAKEAVSHPQFSAVVDSVIMKSPTIGFLIPITTGGKIAQSLSEAVSTAARAGKISARAANILSKVASATTWTIFGQPEEFLRPFVVPRVSEYLTRKAIEGALKAEGATVMERIAKAITKPSPALGDLIQKGFKPQLAAEAIAQTMSRSLSVANTLYSAFSGSVTGAIFMSPQIGDERDYLAGLLTGLTMSSGFSVLGWVGKNLARRAGIPVPDFQAPPEIEYVVWANFRQLLTDILGVDSFLSPKLRPEEAARQLAEWGSAFNRLFRSEYASTLLHEIYNDYIGARRAALQDIQERKSVIRRVATGVYRLLPDDLKSIAIEDASRITPENVKKLFQTIHRLAVKFLTDEGYDEPLARKMAWVVTGVITDQLLGLRLHTRIGETFEGVENLRRKVLSQLHELPEYKKAFAPTARLDIQDLAVSVSLLLHHTVRQGLMEAPTRVPKPIAAAVRGTAKKVIDALYADMDEAFRTGLTDRVALEVFYLFGKEPPSGEAIRAIPTYPMVIVSEPPPRELPQPTLDDVQQIANFIFTRVVGDKKAASDARGLINAARRIYGDSAEGVTKALEALDYMQASKTAARKAEFILYHMERYGLLTPERARELRREISVLYRTAEKQFSSAGNLDVVKNVSTELMSNIVGVMQRAIAEARLDREANDAIIREMRMPEVSPPERPRVEVPGEIPTFIGTTDIQRASFLALLPIIPFSHDYFNRVSDIEARVFGNYPVKLAIAQISSPEQVQSTVNKLKSENWLPFVYRMVDEQLGADTPPLWVVVGVKGDVTPESAKQLSDAVIWLLGGRTSDTVGLDWGKVSDLFAGYNDVLRYLRLWYENKDAYKRALKDPNIRERIKEMVLSVIPPYFFEVIDMLRQERIGERKFDWLVLRYGDARDAIRYRSLRALRLAAIEDLDDYIRLYWGDNPDIPFWVGLYSFGLRHVLGIEFHPFSILELHLLALPVSMAKRISRLLYAYGEGRKDIVETSLGNWLSGLRYRMKVKIVEGSPTPLRIEKEAPDIFRMEISDKTLMDLFGFYFNLSMEYSRRRHKLPRTGEVLVAYLRSRPDIEETIPRQIRDELYSAIQMFPEPVTWDVEVPFTAPPIEETLPHIANELRDIIRTQYGDNEDMVTFATVFTSTPVGFIYIDRLRPDEEVGIVDPLRPHAIYLTFSHIRPSSIAHELTHKLIHTLDPTPDLLSGYSNFRIGWGKDIELRKEMTNVHNFLRRLPDVRDVGDRENMLRLVRGIYFLLTPDAEQRRAAPYFTRHSRSEDSYYVVFGYYFLNTAGSLLNWASDVVSDLLADVRNYDLFRMHGWQGLSDETRKLTHYFWSWFKVLTTDLQVTKDPRIREVIIPLFSSYDALLNVNQEVIGRIRQVIPETDQLINQIIGLIRESDLPISQALIQGIDIFKVIEPEHFVGKYLDEVMFWNNIPRIIRDFIPEEVRHMFEGDINRLQTAVNEFTQRLREFIFALPHWVLSRFTHELNVTPDELKIMSASYVYHTSQNANTRIKAFDDLYDERAQNILLSPRNRMERDNPLPIALSEIFTDTAGLMVSGLDTARVNDMVYALLEFYAPLLIDAIRNIDKFVNEGSVFMGRGEDLANLYSRVREIFVNIHHNPQLLNSLRRNLENMSAFYRQIYDIGLVVHFSDAYEFIRNHFAPRALAITEEIGRLGGIPFQVREMRKVEPEVPDIKSQLERIQDISQLISAFLPPTRSPDRDFVVERILSDPMLTRMSTNSGYELLRSLLGTEWSLPESFMRLYDNVVFPELKLMVMYLNSLVDALEITPQGLRWRIRRWEEAMQYFRLLDTVVRDIEELFLPEVHGRILARLEANGVPFELAAIVASNTASQIFADAHRLLSGVIPKLPTETLQNLTEIVTQSPFIRTTPTGRVTAVNPVDIWRASPLDVWTRVEPPLDVLAGIDYRSPAAPVLRGLYRRIVEFIDGLWQDSRRSGEVTRVAFKEWYNSILNNLNNPQAVLNEIRNFPEVVFDTPVRARAGVVMASGVWHYIRRELVDVDTNSIHDITIRKLIEAARSSSSHEDATYRAALKEAVQSIMERMYALSVPYISASDWYSYTRKSARELARLTSMLDLFSHYPNIWQILRHQVELGSEWFSEISKYPQPIRTVILETLDRLIYNRIVRLLLSKVGSYLHEGKVTEDDVIDLRRVALSTWENSGVDGLLQLEWVAPTTPNIRVRFTPGELDEVIRELIPRIAHIKDDIDRVMERLNEFMASDEMALIRNLSGHFVHMREDGSLTIFDNRNIEVDPYGLAQKFINHVSEYFLAGSEAIKAMVIKKLPGRLPEEVANDIERVRKFVEEGDIGELANFIRERPDTFIEIIYATIPLITADVLDRFARRIANQLQLLSLSGIVRIAEYELRRRSKGLISTRLLGLLAGMAGVMWMAKEFPAVASVLGTAISIVTSAPLFKPLLIAGALGTAGILLIRALKGHGILKATGNVMSSVLPRVEAIGNEIERKIQEGVQNLAQLVGQTDNQLASIILELTNEFAIPHATPLDGVIDELSKAAIGQQGAVFTQKQIRDTIGRSARITASDRRKFAENVATRIGILSILHGNQALLDVLNDLGAKTMDSILLLSGLRNIAQSPTLSNEVTRNYLAYAFALFLRRQSDWSAIANQPLRDVWRRTVLSVKPAAPGGQRQRFKVTDFEIVDAQGNIRIVGDMTVKEFFDEVLRGFGNVPGGWSYDALAQLGKSERDSVINYMIGELRARMKDFIRNRADTNLIENYALGALALDGVRMARRVLTDPEAIAALEYLPLMKEFFVVNLMESMNVLNYPQVRSGLGRLGDMLYDFYDTYLREIQRNDPVLYREAQQIFRDGRRVSETLIYRLQTAKPDEVPSLFAEYYKSTEKLLRKWLHTAARRLEIAGIPRQQAEILRHMIAEPGAYINAAWSRLTRTPYNPSILNQVLQHYIAPFILNSPYARIYIDIVAGAKPPKNIATPIVAWRVLGAKMANLAKTIAQAEKIPAERIYANLNKLAYYAYTAVREGSGIRSFDDIFARYIDPDVAAKINTPKWRPVVEALAAHMAINAAYLTNMLSAKAWTGEVIFRGQPHFSLLGKAYFPLSAELAEVSRDIFSSLFGDMFQLLFEGPDDKIIAQRLGIGKRTFHYERTGAASPKSEQFHEVLTNFFRSINAYNALLPYASMLKGIMYVTPKYLLPALAREVHLAVGSPLLRRGYINAFEALADTLSRSAEGWELIAHYLPYSVSAFITQLAAKAGDISARMLSVSQTVALSANLASIIRQLTTFPYAASRLVHDFAAPEYALLPLFYFPRALLIATKSDIQLTPLERVLLNRMPALQARREQTLRAAILRGMDLINEIVRGKGALANEVAVLLDPSKSDVEKLRAMENINRHFTTEGLLSEKLLSWGLYGLQLFDEAMVIATALAGMEAFIRDALTKKIAITDDVIRQAVAYGMNLAESVQATPAISFAPLAFQNPMLAATVIGPALRQFVVVGFATAETFSKLIFNTPIKSLATILDVLRGRRPMGEITDALEQLSAALVAIAVLNLGLMGLNGLYQAITGRNLEEQPLGQPPDDESKSLLQIPVEIVAASTPRAVQRLINLMTYAFSGGAPQVMDTIMTTDVPPIVRLPAQVYNAVTKGVEIYRAYSLMGEVEKFRNQPAMKRILDAIEYARRSGTDVSKISTVSDIIQALVVLTPTISPEMARLLQWLPLGQLSRSARAITEIRSGMPSPAAVQLGEQWGEVVQVAAGLPLMFGTYPSMAIFQKLAGPVTEIIRKRASAVVKATEMSQALKPVPSFGVFVGLTEYARRANTLTDINTVIYLTYPPFWLKREGYFASVVREFAEAGATSEAAVYNFIASKPNDFTAMVAIFGPEGVAMLAGKTGKDWFYQGQFVPQNVIMGMRRYGFLNEANQKLASYLTNILVYTSEHNLRDYAFKKRREIYKRQQIQRGLTLRETAKKIRGRKEGEE